MAEAVDLLQEVLELIFSYLCIASHLSDIFSDSSWKFLIKKSKFWRRSRIVTAEDIKLWIGDHNLFISGETFIPEKQIRKIRRDHFCPILMSFLLVVLPSLPTILTMPVNKWGKCTLVGPSIFQFWS